METTFSGRRDGENTRFLQSFSNTIRIVLKK